MKRKYLALTMASAGGLFISGPVLAGCAAMGCNDKLTNWSGPILFDQFTVTNGTITDTSIECFVGWTCVTLDATSNGMLMQQVTEPANGISFIRTIVTEENANGTTSSGLNFWQETENYASGINANNVAIAQGIVDGGIRFIMNLYEGAFKLPHFGADISIPTSGGAGAEMYLNQLIASSGQTFQQEGVNANMRLRIDQFQGTNPGKFTYAAKDGTKYQTSGGTLGGTVMPALAYASTDGISVVWIGADMPGNYDASLRQFGYQQFRNWGSLAVTAPGTNVAVGTSTYSSVGPLGTFSANGSWDWDAALWDLGAAPSGP